MRLLALLLLTSVLSAAIPGTPQLIPVFTLKVQVQSIQSLYTDDAQQIESIIGIVGNGSVATIENTLGLAVQLQDVAGFDHLVSYTAKNSGNTNVQLHGKTPDGTDVGISYQGLLVSPGGLQAVLSGHVTSPDDYSLVSNPKFSFGGSVPADLAWLEKEVFMAKGSFVAENGASYVAYTVHVMR